MNKLSIENILEYSERLPFYNNYSFLRNDYQKYSFQVNVLASIFDIINSQSCQIIEINIKDLNHLFVVKKLDWDSNYFKFNCLSIECVFFKHADFRVLHDAINILISKYLPPKSYITINVTSEDLILIKALSFTKFILIETRLNYFLDLAKRINIRNLNNVKDAEIIDIPALRSIAIKMKNKFDRVHADPAFSEKEADNYIAKFAEESVKGFANIVLKVDNEYNIPFGFLAGNYPIDVYGIFVSKLVLAAVDSSVQKGKLLDLLDVMINRLKNKNADFLTTITQAANIPAIRTWEKAGFKLYKVTNLYSIKND